MDEVYSPSEYTLGYPEGIEFHFWNRARNDLLYRLLQPLVDRDDLVMDVGCGPGVFLGFLQGKQVNARGVEKGSPVVKPGLESIISTDTDLFRIKIWDIDDGDAVVYDNQMGEPDDSTEGTAIEGGNISIK